MTEKQIPSHALGESKEAPSGLGAVNLLGTAPTDPEPG